MKNFTVSAWTLRFAVLLVCTVLGFATPVAGQGAGGQVRAIDAFEAAILAKQRGMRGIV